LISVVIRFIFFLGSEGLNCPSHANFNCHLWRLSSVKVKRSGVCL
jgi:hypothetical protein